MHLLSQHQLHGTAALNGNRALEHFINGQSCNAGQEPDKSSQRAAVPAAQSVNDKTGPTPSVATLPSASKRVTLTEPEECPSQNSSGVERTLSGSVSRRTRITTHAKQRGAHSCFPFIL